MSRGCALCPAASGGGLSAPGQLSTSVCFVLKHWALSGARGALSMPLRVVLMLTLALPPPPQSARGALSIPPCAMLKVGLFARGQAG